MNNTQRQFIDIQSRLIDAPTQFRGKREGITKNLNEQLKQLPWALEAAIVNYLHSIKSDWFKEQPCIKFPEAIFNNSDESAYFSDKFELLDYSFSNKVPLSEQSYKRTRPGRVSLSVE